MNKLFDITVIIAVFNAGKTLEECLLSIIEQVGVSVQIVVIDGGSSDDSPAIAAKYADFIDYYISESDGGIYDAWNKGLNHIKSEWVFFLGADDYLWHSNVLSDVLGNLTHIPAEVNIAYGPVMVVNKDREPLYKIGQPWDEVKQDFRRSMCLPHPAAMHRSAIFEKYGNFNAAFKIAGDYEFLLRDLLANNAIFIDVGPVVGMRHGGMSSNPKNALKGYKEMIAARKIHGLTTFSTVLFFIKIRIYIRHLIVFALGDSAARTLLDLGRRFRGLPPLWTKI